MLKKHDSYTIQKTGEDKNNKVVDIYYNTEDDMFYADNMYENVPFDSVDNILDAIENDGYDIL